MPRGTYKRNAKLPKLVKLPKPRKKPDSGLSSWGLTAEIHWIDSVLREYPNSRKRATLLRTPKEWLEAYIVGFQLRHRGFGTAGNLPEDVKLKIAGHVGLRLSELRRGLKISELS